MTKEEAIKYLQQLYPNGSHCWLDEQRIEAIDMAVKSLQEEPISEDLEKEIKRYQQEVYDRDTTVKDVAHHFANWQKERFEKNRLAACDRQTPEEAEREMNFAINIIEKEHRTPTYDDAIKYGMKLQKEEMMIKTIDAQCFGFQGAALFSFRLPADKYLVGSKVKVIVVKEE